MDTIGAYGQMPAYKLQNLGGNIKRNRDRLAQLRREATARAADVSEELEGRDGATVRFTAARVEVEYPGKPSEEIRSTLKGAGFRWDRVAMCWQAPIRYAPAVELARVMVAPC